MMLLKMFMRIVFRFGFFSISLNVFVIFLVVVLLLMFRKFVGLLLNSLMVFIVVIVRFVLFMR